MTAGRKQLLARMGLVWSVPLLLATLTGYLAWQVIDDRNRLIETTGTVVKVYEWENDNPFDSAPHVYGPVFRFTWSDGQETEASTGMSSSDYNFPVGSQMTIRYDRLHKGNVVIAGPGEWFFVQVAAWVLAGAAVLALIGSILILRRAKRKEVS